MLHECRRLVIFVWLVIPYYLNVSVSNHIRKRWIKKNERISKLPFGNRSEYGILLSVERNGNTAYRWPVTSILFTRHWIYLMFSYLLHYLWQRIKYIRPHQGRWLNSVFRRSNNLNLRLTKRYRCGYPIIKR